MNYNEILTWNKQGDVGKRKIYLTKKNDDIYRKKIIQLQKGTNRCFIDSNCCVLK